MVKPKILLAESSSIVLQIAQRCLKDAKVGIFVATDSEEALNMARKIRPDLVYLAYSLHGTGGVPCCKAFKADPELKDIPVVMVCTAAGEEPENSRAAGCDAVVTKPIACREFLETGLSLVTRTDASVERMPCRAIAACTLGADTFYGTIEDISSTGMFVGSTREVAAGEVLKVKFVLPWTSAVPIETEVQVNWVNGGRQPRRSEHLPVNHKPSMLDCDLLARQGRHALVPELACGKGRHQVGFEDHDVAAFRRRKPIGRSLREQAIAGDERRRHAPSLKPKGAGELLADDPFRSPERASQRGESQPPCAPHLRHRTEGSHEHPAGKRQS